jgi:hypothetical protein
MLPCQNKLCALWNKEHDENCSGFSLGLEKLDKQACNVRKLYVSFVKRETHDRWLDKKREEWNSYQLAWRKKKNFPESVVIENTNTTISETKE